MTAAESASLGPFCVACGQPFAPVPHKGLA